MFQKPKGTRDIFGDKAKIFLKIKDVFFQKSQNFNFQYIETPIFENAELFNRSAGETSDIVNKEMYLFEDRGNRLMALRPEGTAPTIRSIVENKFYIDKNKFFYFGPMFRYERPQKGRYRQFYQGGVEFISKNNIYNDLEIIQLAISILDALEIKNYTLKINNLGSKTDRLKYNEVLKEYFNSFKGDLSEISQSRIDKNPMRILDDKLDSDKDFVKQAPSLSDYVSLESQNYFMELQKLLNKSNINFEIDKTLVRGLDYYDNLVFEFVSSSEGLGTKSTIIGGGRYNSMFAEFGGPDLSAIGFGLGVERLLDKLEFQKPKFIEKSNLDFYVATFNENEWDQNLAIINSLRKNHFNVEYNKEIVKISKIFKDGQNSQAQYMLFKEKDQKENEFVIKNMITNEKQDISFEQILNLRKDLDE